MKQEYINLFEKCEALKDDQFLYTTFGPDRYYKIRRYNDEFIITEYKNRWLFQEDGKLLSQSSFDSVEGLKNAVLYNPKWYAQNVFTGQMKHHDNWVNFVNAFKLAVVEKEKVEGKQLPNYYINFV